MLKKKRRTIVEKGSRAKRKGIFRFNNHCSGIKGDADPHK